MQVNPFAGFMASLGLASILQVAVGKAFGIENRSVPTVFPGGMKVLGGYVSFQRLVVIVFSVIIVGGLWYFLMRTRVGRGVRAVAQNSEAASLQGIDWNSISSLSMGVAAALAAASGSLMGSIFAIGPPALLGGMSSSESRSTTVVVYSALSAGR